MVPYIIRTGDHLALIAHKMGFDLATVWEDPKNADLKKLRGSPNILCVGDVLYVPEQRVKNWLPVNVGATNKFVGTVPTVPLSVIFSKGGKPIANAECILRGLPSATPLSTDGDGKLVTKVPVTMQVVVIEIPSVHMVRTLRIGHLDPITEPSGVAQRLANLGYVSARTRVDTSEEGPLARLVAAFQVDSGLPSTGETDSDTLDALNKAHGC